MSDRDLDIALARALGWHCEAYEFGWRIISPDGHRGKGRGFEEAAWERDGPRFSRDWAGLGLLIEAMWAQGWRLHVTAFPPEMVRPVSVSWSHIEHQSAKADGDGVPQQAALAAARALGIAVEE